MKLSNNLKALTAAAVLAVPAMAPTMASAEVGYSANIASMYLWRGQNVSDGAPALSGSVDYSHESGAYAFAWMSSEGISGTGGSATDAPDTDGYEVDFGVGYAGEAGPVSYDVSYYTFNYPEENAHGEETVISLGYEMASLTFYLGDGYEYTTIGAEFGAASVTYGMTTDDTDADWTHIDLGFAATDELSFTLSLPSDDGAGIAEEPLLMMSYSLPIGK